MNKSNRKVFQMNQLGTQKHGQDELSMGAVVSKLGLTASVGLICQMLATSASAQPRPGWVPPARPTGPQGTVVVRPPGSGPQGTVVVAPPGGGVVVVAPSCQQGAPEVCGDRIDNNCNGIIDEGCGPIAVPVNPGHPGHPGHPPGHPGGQPPVVVVPPAQPPTYPQPGYPQPGYPQPGYPQPGYPGGQVISYDQPQMIQGSQVLRLRQLLNLGPQFDGQFVQSVEVDAASQFGGIISLDVNGRRELTLRASQQIQTLTFQVGRTLGRNYGEIQTLQLEVQNVFIRSIRVRLGQHEQPGQFERRELSVNAMLSQNVPVSLNALVSPLDRGRNLVRLEILAQAVHPSMMPFIQFSAGQFQVQARPVGGSVYPGQPVRYIAEIHQVIGMGGIHPRSLLLTGANVHVHNVAALLR